MTTVKQKAPLIGQIIFGAVTLFSAQSSNALVISDSLSIIDWGSFTITLDPGIQLHWREQYSYATARVDVNDSTSVDYQSNSVSDWDSDVSAFAAYPGIAHISDVQDDMLSSASSVINTGGERLHTQDTAQRTGYFDIIGDGTVTFSLDYILHSAAFNTGPDWGYAGARSILSLNNLTLGTDLESFDLMESISFANALSGESDSDSVAGTLTASWDFSDGDYGVVIAQAFSFAHYNPGEEPEVSVPEPGTLFMFGLGLIALVIARKTQVAAV